jgi:hypothetical protein
MHSIHCRSAVFLYQMRVRRPAQETLVGYVGLHDTKEFEGIEHLFSIYYPRKLSWELPS